MHHPLCGRRGAVAARTGVRQRPGDMIFSVARIVRFLSQDTTLLPGTVILTGTRQGVGFVRTPPVFLGPGDRVTVEVDGVGAMTNTVVAASGR